MHWYGSICSEYGDKSVYYPPEDVRDFLTKKKEEKKDTLFIIATSMCALCVYSLSLLLLRFPFSPNYMDI